MFDFSEILGGDLDILGGGNKKRPPLDDFTRKRLNITEQGDTGKAAESYQNLIQKNVRYDASINRDRVVNQALGQDLGNMEEGQYESVLSDLKQISSPTGFDITSDIGSREDQVAQLKNYVASVKEEAQIAGQTREKQLELGKLYNDLVKKTKSSIEEMKGMGEEDFSSLVGGVQERVGKADLSGTNLGDLQLSSSPQEQSFSSLGREEQLEKLVNYTSSIQSETGKFERGTEERDKLSSLLQDLSGNVQEGMKGISGNDKYDDEQWSNLVNRIEEKVNRADLSGTDLGRLTSENTERQSFQSLPREEQIAKLQERRGALESDTLGQSNARNQNIREFASQLSPTTGVGLFQQLIDQGRENIGDAVGNTKTSDLVSEMFGEDPQSVKEALKAGGDTKFRGPKDEKDAMSRFENMGGEDQDKFREQLEQSVRDFRERQANFFVRDIQRMEEEVSSIQDQMLNESDTDFSKRIRGLADRNEISSQQSADISSLPREEAVEQYGRMVGETQIQNPMYWSEQDQAIPQTVLSNYENMSGVSGASPEQGVGGIGDMAAAFGMGMAGGTLSGAATGGVGGGSGRGGGTTSSAASSPDDGDNRQSRMGEFLQGRGATALTGTLGAAGILTDMATPGGRSAAESTIGGLNTGAPLIGAAVGSLIPGVGTIAGGAAGHYLGQGISQASQPYMQYQAQQRQYEGMTGEDQDRGFGSMLSSMAPGGDTIQSAQVSARWSNPFMATEQIQQLTDQMLQLGLSSEQAAEAIGPAAEAVNDFAISSELAGTLAATGALPGNQFGAQNPMLIGQRIQNAAQQGGMTQQSIGNLVQSTTQNLGPTIGYENAPGAAISTATTLSRGGMEGDMIFEQQQTGQKMMEGMGNAANDIGVSSMLGVDPNLSPEDPEFEAQTREGQVELIHRLAGGLPKDGDGNLTVTGRTTLQSMMQSYGPALGNMSVDEAEEIVNQNITPEQARKDSEEQNQQDKRDQNKMKRKAGGVGQKLTGRREVEREDEGVRGFANKFLPGPFKLGANPRSRHQQSIMEASERQQGKAGKKDSIGATAELIQNNEDIDLSKVELAGGGDLRNAARDNKMAALNKGDQKLKVGDQKMTIQEFNLKQQKGEAFVGEKGALRLGKEGQDKGGGGGSMKIDLTDRAAKLIEVKDIRGNGGMPAEVQASQDRYARNHKGKRLNDSPTYK